MCRSWVGRLGISGGAHALVKLEEYVFDYVFYPYMLFIGGPGLAGLLGMTGGNDHTGYWLGFAVLLSASTLLNIIYLRAYDASGRDWFGFEYLRGRAPLTKSRWKLLGNGAVRGASFVYLSIWHSPLFATLWLRSGAGEPTYLMTRRDWWLFGAAIVTANFGWTLIVSVVAALARFGWHR